jgi:hypothetical protein
MKILKERSFKVDGGNTFECIYIVKGYDETFDVEEEAIAEAKEIGASEVYMIIIEQDDNGQEIESERMVVWKA